MDVRREGVKVKKGQSQRKERKTMRGEGRRWALKALTNIDVVVE
jgi:hypothetical protein